MRFGVLGPLAVWTSAGEPVTVPGLKVRAVLADLIVHDGRPVSTDRLVEDLWGADVPANPAGALQVRVSQLRKALSDAEPGGRDLIVSRPPGYLLAAEPDAVDAWRFAALAARAEQAPDARTRAGLLADALALWRGNALADFADDEFARAAIARLEEQRLAVIELHAEARLELGEHSLLAGELGDLVARYPLRERLRAVHMRALYQAGRQSEALDSFADLRRRLDEEMGLEPGPELVALQQAILEQDSALEPERATRRPRTNLTAPLTELIGRDAAVTEVRALLGGARLVTLTGPGGVGKTRLALETAARLVDETADGVWLVELAPVDADAVADEVLAVLGIRDSDPAPAAEKLAAALHARHTLLVLDNCEHLVESAAALAEGLLRAAPGVRVLATSREPLGVPGEVVWDVPPLDVPGPGDDDPTRSGAVRLFAARAAAAARGFAVDAGNRDAVAQLCARLDGIPLALELAATRVRTLGVHGLVERLDDRFRLLTAGARGAPARQRTLAAVIDWSWELLSPAEQAVLRRLAVHNGGCTVEAAEATCAGDDVSAVEVVDLLTRLVDRSLVVLADQQDGPRFRLLETVAAYCADRLRDAGEFDEVRARHAAYYTDLAVRAEPFLRGPEQSRWLRRLDAESGNLHDAIAHGADTLRLVNALTWYWFLRGRLPQARRALAAAIAGPGPDDQRARAVAWHAAVEVMQGESAGWSTRRQAAIDAVDAITDESASARARWILAYAENGLVDTAGTDRLLADALAVFERIGDRWGVAAVLTTRATMAHARTDVAALEADAERAAELFQAIGDRWGVLQATEWVAALAEMTGDHERAIRLHREGLRMAEELELWPDVAGRLGWLGWLALQLGDHDQARELCEQAMRLAAEQNSHANLVFAELGLGFAARRAGKLDIAETHLRNLVETAKRQDDGAHPPYLSMVLVDLGFVAEARGDAEEAIALHLEAFDVAERMGDTRGDAYAAEGLAGALTLAGRPVEAARLLGAADARRRSLGLPQPPEERDEVNRIGAAVRAALGDDRFAAEFAVGGETGLAELRATLGPQPSAAAGR
ncbi:BTAD domain-containing putative transcriptional regulator [Actinokineospora fastidiosa]|uniref:SARP family transcriptional regulator n=1 Tax=Actinokineospora fastidiosa TaxID=1816 RepID=A0A918GEC6_9PSEU|nr:BTAD domain-containing putative transcriptional regulator [Actinokineospora fastidiosa]GGS31161.1 SARP family transcriptional regulator [Actinokineospora fastidiosa]